MYDSVIYIYIFMYQIKENVLLSINNQALGCKRCTGNDYFYNNHTRQEFRYWDILCLAYNSDIDATPDTTS